MEAINVTNPLQLFRSAFCFETSEASEIQNLIHQQYSEALVEKYEGYKAQLLSKSPEDFERLAIAELDIKQDELKNLLLIPEISFLVLKHHLADQTIMLDVLIEAINAVQSANTGSFNTDLYKQLWVPDGSHFLKFNSQTSSFDVYEAFRLLDGIPVDFFSPYCLKISNQDVNEPPHHMLKPYGFNEIEEICGLFEDAVTPIYDIPALVNQLTLFLKAIVVNKITNNGIPTSLVSGSDARFIGRTVISNVLGADPMKLIEAFVHESIHSTLYMGDTVTQWLPTRAETHAAGYNAVSPWTGNKISISSIQEAIYVWYGIYKLWKIAINNNFYNNEAVIERLHFVWNGFNKLNIEKIASENNFRLRVDFLEEVQWMKSDITGNVTF